MFHHNVRVPVKPVTTYPDVRNHEVVEPQLVPRLVVHSVGVGTEEDLLLLRIRTETFSSSEDTTVTVEGTTRTTTFLRERSGGGERRGGTVGWHVECEELMGNPSSQSVIHYNRFPWVIHSPQLSHRHPSSKPVFVKFVLVLTYLFSRPTYDPRCHHNPPPMLIPF